MKHGFFNYPPLLQVLAHDSLEKRQVHIRIPDTFGINDDDRTGGAHAKAARLTALHSPRAKEQPFPLKQSRKLRIQLTSAPVG